MPLLVTDVTTPMTSPARQAEFVVHLMLGERLDPPVLPHEQEVFDELAREVAAAKAKQGREVIPDDTEGGMWPGEGGLESSDDE